MKKTMANVTHLVRLATIGTATASLSIAGMIPPAQSAVPTCVQTRLSDGRFSDTVTVTNRCSTTQRVKALWAFGTDSPCYQLRPNYYFTSTRSYPARFDGLRAC